MALSQITITEGQSNSRILTSTDNKSALVFYLKNTSLPSSYSATTSQTVFSLSDAEALGLTSTSYPVVNYHVSEFYRVNDSGQLQLGLVNFTGGTHTFNELSQVMNDATGNINQIGVWTSNNLSTGMVTQLESVLDTLKANDTPAVALLAPCITGYTLTSLPDLSSSSAKMVSVVIGQDGGNVGAQLFATNGKSVSALGATLGAVGSSSVHESISWKGKFDLSGTELDTIAFSNGTPYKSVSKTQLGTLNDKHYIFLLKDVGLNGSFFNSSSTCIADSSDYSTIERNRVINKARKQLRTAMLPQLNSPLYLQDDGTLTIETVSKFESLCDQALAVMKRNGEVSNYSIAVDSTHNVLSDDTLNINVSIQPVGVARFINITLGFVVSIA